MLDDSWRKIKTKRYEVVDAWPHDCQAFTEGLKFYNGVLYESTGGDKDTPDIGLSSVRRVDLRTGRVLQKVSIDKEYFAEGLTIFGNKVFQVTYQTNRGFIYDLNLHKLDEFCYAGEGWGLTSDNQHLILSDGSTGEIRFLDPASFELIRTIPVMDGNTLLKNINELEYVRGNIYANVWYEKRIVCINPGSGTVDDSIDLTKLCRPYEDRGVLNGVAYDEAHDLWFVTGKLWPRLFAIRLKKPRHSRFSFGSRNPKLSSTY